MMKYLRPLLMMAMLAVTLASAACTNGNSDGKQKSDTSSPFGSGDSGGD
jgi:hypothetical protein